ncbi:sensor histidine kinase [bacterium]|nr:sensor histidine kinase [bacterium]
MTTLLAMPLQGSHVSLLIGLVIARTVLFLIVGGLISQLVMLEKRQQRDLLRANQDLHQYAMTREKLVVSQERNRLARELHDTLAHTLSATAVQLEAIGLILDTQPEKARSLLVQATSRTREGLSETRRALEALRAAPVEDMGLGKAIAVLAQSVAARHQVQVETRFTGDPFLLNPDHEHSIYRIVQEAVTNAVRHACAKQIAVQIDYRIPVAVVAISDDGLGFDPETAPRNGHYGLRGMQERAQQMNATLEINSTLGSGTTIVLSVRT